jgi:hypothetical protein
VKAALFLIGVNPFFFAISKKYFNSPGKVLQLFRKSTLSFWKKYFNFSEKVFYLFARSLLSFFATRFWYPWPGTFSEGLSWFRKLFAGCSRAVFLKLSRQDFIRQLPD